MPGQHGPGQLDGHLAWMGRRTAGPLHGPAGPVDGRLGLEQVEDRLDDDEVDAALDEGVGLLLVGVAELGVADLPERGELGARADAAGHPTGPVRGREVVGRLAGEGRSSQVQLADPVGSGRTRPAPGRRPRRCRSRPRRTRPRRTTGGPGRRRRVGSPPGARCSPRGPGPPKSSAVELRSCRLVPMAPSKTTTRSRGGLEVARRSDDGRDGGHGPSRLPAEPARSGRAPRDRPGAPGRPDPGSADPASEDGRGTTAMSFSIGAVRTPC